MNHKLLIATVLASFLALAATAQRGVNAIFREYKHTGHERVHFMIPGALFKVGSIFGRDRVERRLIRSIGTMRLLVIGSGSPVNSEDVQKMMRRAERSGVEPLIEVREGGGTHVAIAAKEKRGKIRRLLLVVRDEDQFVLIRMKGRIRIEDVNRLIQKSGSKSGAKIPKLPIPEPKKEEVPQV